MSTLHIRMETERFTRDMMHFEREHLPMSIVFCLNRTAVDVQRAVQDRTRSVFNLHTEFIPRGVRVRNASISELRNTGETQSEVYTAPIISGFMPLHETSGNKTPRNQNIAVPSNMLQRDSAKTGTGKIRANLLPRQLLRDFNSSRLFGRVPVRASRSRGRRQAFLAKSKKGNTIVMRRTGPKRDRLEVLYTFHRRTKIDDVWEFRKTAEKIVPFVFDYNFKKAFTAVSLLR